jgi:O-antigen/teichoic acid export membrane protein
LNLLAVDQGSGRFTRFNATRLLAAATMPVLLAIAWATGVLSVATATWLMIPATLLGLALPMAWSADRRFWLPGRPRAATLLREGLPYASSVLVCDLFNRLDTILILWLATLTQQGLYAAAVPAVQMLSVAPEVLAVFSFNAGTKEDGRLGLRKFILLAGGLLAFQAISALAYGSVLGWLITLVYGKKFHGAIVLAMALLPGQLFQGCAIVADGYLRGRGQAGVGIRARLVGAVAMGLAACLLVGPLQVLAIPVAASIGGATSALWIGAAILRQSGWQPGWPTSPRGQT